MLLGYILWGRLGKKGSRQDRFPGGFSLTESGSWQMKMSRAFRREGFDLFRPPHCRSLGAPATVNGNITGSEEEEG
jgi:hypothetical protein